MSVRQVLEGVHRRIDAAVGGHGRLGVQFYASLRGEPLIEIAAGEYRPGEPMTTDNLVPWLCACKPLTVLALAQLYDSGELTPAMRVSDVIPEFAAAGKREVTLEHLLSHTVVYLPGDDQPWLLDRAGALACVYDWPLAAAPGERAAYSAFGSWLVLSEVLRRISGTSFYDLVREQVMKPLDMHASTFFETPGDTAPGGVTFERGADGGLSVSEPPAGAVEWPGAGMWGPVAELARPLECVVGGGVWRGNRIISAEAVELFFTTRRIGIPDEYFDEFDLTWSLGACTEPAWFGAPPNARIAGQDGLFRSLVMGDLDHQLVVAYLSNTVVPGEPMLQRLDNLLVEDAYELVEPR